VWNTRAFPIAREVQGDEVRRGSSVLLGLGRAVPSAELQTSFLASLTMSAHRHYSLKSRRRIRIRRRRKDKEDEEDEEDEEEEDEEDDDEEEEEDNEEEEEE
jgi:DNA-directed RNA polymerase specialized sigma24 family protein